jgi:hypothetical protein
MHLHLRSKFFARIQEGERVVVRLIEELDAAGFVQLHESVEDFRRILLELLDRTSAKGEGDAKPAFVHLDGIQQHPVGRQVTSLGYFPKQFGILKFIEVMTIGIEHAVPPKTERLMDLKIKADGRHTNVVPSVVEAAILATMGTRSTQTSERGKSYQRSVVADRPRRARVLYGN